MDRVTDEPDVVVEEYEEIIGDLDEFSDRTDTEYAETESIQEPTSVDRRILTTHTGRPSLRSTNARLAGSQEESKPVVVTCGNGCTYYQASSQPSRLIIIIFKSQQHYTIPN